MESTESPRFNRPVVRRTSASTGNRSDESIRRVSTIASSIRRVASTTYMPTTYKKPWATIDEESTANARRRNARFENTYRMEPKIPFPVAKVHQIVKDALATLVSQSYEPGHTGLLVKLLSQRILDEVKQLNAERYKLVCLVSIGAKGRQGVRFASRCLWNTDYDTCVSETMEKHDFYATATVYAMYFE